MPHDASFIALCDVLDLLTCINSGLTDPDLLDAAIMVHLTKYQAAYDAIGWVPKHHVSLHLAEQFRRHKTLASLFTCERRHNIVKRFILARHTDVAFEKGVSEEMTLF
jgi:hypothetical protein